MACPSVRIPVLSSDDDEVAYEPTQRAQVSFGEWTLPVRGGTRPLTPVGPLARPATAPLAVSPIPRKPTRTADESMPTPMIAPPPSASRAIAMGLAIGTTLGVGLLAAAWHFLV